MRHTATARRQARPGCSFPCDRPARPGPVSSWMQLAGGLPGPRWVGCSLERASPPRPEVTHDLDAALRAPHHHGPRSGTTWMQLWVRPPCSARPRAKLDAAPARPSVGCGRVLSPCQWAFPPIWQLLNVKSASSSLPIRTARKCAKRGAPRPAACKTRRTSATVRSSGRRRCSQTRTIFRRSKLSRSNAAGGDSGCRSCLVCCARSAKPPEPTVGRVQYAAHRRPCLKVGDSGTELHPGRA